MKPVVRNIRSNELYFYEGDNVFTNIASGVSGKVSDLAAQKTFKINVEATTMLNEFPVAAEMIKKLNLKLSNDKGDTNNIQGSKI